MYVQYPMEKVSKQKVRRDEKMRARSRKATPWPRKDAQGCATKKLGARLRARARKDAQPKALSAQQSSAQQ